MINTRRCSLVRLLMEKSNCLEEYNSKDKLHLIQQVCGHRCLLIYRLINPVAEKKPPGLTKSWTRVSRAEASVFEIKSVARLFPTNRAPHACIALSKTGDFFSERKVGAWTMGICVRNVVKNMCTRTSVRSRTREYWWETHNNAVVLLEWLLG